MTPTNPLASSSLHDTMRYFEEQRKGSSPDDILEERLQEKYEAQMKTSDAIISALTSRGKQVKESLETLTTAAEKVNYHTASDTFMTQLSKTTQALKEIQEGIQKCLHEGGQELVKLRAKKVELQNILQQLRLELKEASKTFPYEEVIKEGGQKLCSHAASKGKR